MSKSICLVCGEYKYGALYICDSCGSKPPDIELSSIITNHYLDGDELSEISNAIKVIKKTIEEEEIRFIAIVYYLSRKWPKITDCNCESIDKNVLKKIEDNYFQYLKELPGQKILCEELVSDISSHRWMEAITYEMQEEDDLWKIYLYDILEEGKNISSKLFDLKVQLGEGTIIQKIFHKLKSLFYQFDYKSMSIKLTLINKEIDTYKRKVDNYCDQVKNGWSERTKLQASYFRGTYLRLYQMANYCKQIADYKSSSNDLVKTEFHMIKQKLTNSYQRYNELTHVISNPYLISKSID